MEKLNITQESNNIEVVNTLIINKLYETAIDTPNNAYLSGHIEVDKTYEEYTKYLAGRVGFKGIRVNNPEGRFQDLTIDTTQDYYIKFEDPVVEQICIDNFASGEGGVLRSDVESITTLGTQFKNNTEITSFNELKYFKSLNTLNESFRGCTSLESIILPPSITTMNNQCFRDCINLKTLGTNTLNISSVIPTALFYNCENLEGELNFPNIEETNSSYGLATGSYGVNFYNCKKLTKISFKNTKSIAEGTNGTIRGSFTGCTSLKLVDLGNSLVNFNYQSFKNCANLKAIIIRNPESIPSAINSSRIFKEWFGNDNTIIYVPDDMVDNYKISNEEHGKNNPFNIKPENILPLSEFDEETIMNS